MLASASALCFQRRLTTIDPVFVNAMSLKRCESLLALQASPDASRQQAESSSCGSPETGIKGEGRRKFIGSVLGCGLSATLASSCTASTPAAASVVTNPEYLPPWLAAASGAIQGIVQNVVKQAVLHPFDTVKTRVQVSSTDKDDQIARRNLFDNLYRGFLPCLISGTPGSATFFAAKEATASAIAQSGLPKPFPTLGGVVAGVLSAKAVKTPFDVAETQAMATQGGDSASSLDWDGSLSSVQKVYAKDGIAGLYRGYGANVAYKLPADAAKFLAYEALRGTDVVGALPPGVAGAAATLASNVVTTPLDVVRTRVMTDSNSAGVVDTLSSLISAGDSSQLWAGLDWRLGRGIVAGAIQFTFLEGTKNVVEGRR